MSARYRCEVDVIVQGEGESMRVAVVKENGKARAAEPQILLARAGQEIDMALAERLGLVKAAKPAENKAGKKGEDK